MDRISEATASTSALRKSTEASAALLQMQRLEEVRENYRKSLQSSMTALRKEGFTSPLTPHLIVHRRRSSTLDFMNDPATKLRLADHQRRLDMRAKLKRPYAANLHQYRVSYLLPPTKATSTNTNDAMGTKEARELQKSRDRFRLLSHGDYLPGFQPANGSIDLRFHNPVAHTIGVAENMARSGIDRITEHGIRDTIYAPTMGSGAAHLAPGQYEVANLDHIMSLPFARADMDPPHERLFVHLPNTPSPASYNTVRTFDAPSDVVFARPPGPNGVRPQTVPGSPRVANRASRPVTAATTGLMTSPPRSPRRRTLKPVGEAKLPAHVPPPRPTMATGYRDPVDRPKPTPPPEIRPSTAPVEVRPTPPASSAPHPHLHVTPVQILAHSSRPGVRIPTTGRDQPPLFAHRAEESSPGPAQYAVPPPPLHPGIAFYEHSHDKDRKRDTKRKTVPR